MNRSTTRVFSQKNTFKLILAGLVVLLMLLPFVTTFNSLLTDLINRVALYRFIESRIVPWEARWVVVILQMLGVQSGIAPAGALSAFFVVKDGIRMPVVLQWNCLGWQSLVLLVASFIAGLQGNFTRLSRLECILIGLLGTFLINIARMVFITLGIYHFNTVFALLIHDYFAAFLTVIWLFSFWWFSYAFVLEKPRS